MSEEIDIPSHGNPAQDGLDNPLRAIVVVNLPDVPEGDMQERMLDSIQTFEEVENFFDKFDEKVAYPNEDHIKYEVGSDGLVVFVVDSMKMKDDVLKFIDDFEEVIDNNTEDVVVTKKAKN